MEINFKDPAKTIVKSVRLNLFNHLLALFRVKFACNLAIRYPVFSGIYVRVVFERV